MTSPYTFEEGFEAGTRGAFDSTTDTQSKLTFPHYSVLAGYAAREVPYQGAYAMQVDLSLGTAAAYVEEAAGFVVAANTAAAMRMYLFVSNDLVTVTTDTFDLFLWQSVGPVSEFSINLLNTAGVITLRGGDPGGGTFRSSGLTLGVWHCVELVINTGTGVNATAILYVDGQQVGAQITGITCAALTQARLGAMNIDAGTTAGILLFDAVVVDDSRIGPWTNRFTDKRALTKTGHFALGPGAVIEANILLSVTGDETMTLWDTDVGDTTDLSRRLFVYNAMRPVTFTRGLYGVIAGTDPIGVVTMHEASDMSVGAVRDLGLYRKI